VRAVGLLICLVLQAAWPPLVAHAANTAGKVQSVRVRLELSSGYAGAETMAQLERALTETIEFALIDQLGGDLHYIVEHQDTVVQTLGKVITSELDKRGFSIEELVVDPGEETEVTVKLHLTQEQVGSFSVRFYLLGNTPVVSELVAADEDALAAELLATLGRTPYGDARWLAGLVSETVEQRLSALSDYADFEHMILVEPGPVTKVVVTFTPKPGAQVVTGYTLSINSQTLLGMTLTRVRDHLAHELETFQGAPLSFITPRLGAVQRAVYQDLVNSRALASFCADAWLKLSLDGCVLRAHIDLESQRYMLNLGTRLDLTRRGHAGYVGRVSGRAGVMPSQDWVVYGEADYFPSAQRAYPALGAGRLLCPGGFLGAAWDFRADAPRLDAQQALSPAVYVSAQVYPRHRLSWLSEIRLHYRIRDYYELQLLANFDGEVTAALAARF